ncbi:MAG: M48 family metalloprotease [Deltaproteobacteria bacterium]|nr:M48 family metalloprotease [Deltaproteobacteria bacterium]
MNTQKKLRVWLLVVLIFFPEIARAITIQEEEELSREFMVAVNEHYEIIRDSIITDYVTRIGEKILAVMPPQPFSYHFHVIKEYTYNAFAGPGGQVFINSGLFEALSSEEEIAGILAHEISHVACRHVSEQIERSKKIGLATLAGVAAGILMGATGAGSAAGATAVGSMAAAQTATLAYSRENETQADQRGLDYLTKAGYSPKGLLTALTKIRSRQWYGKEQIPTYLMTHPAVEDRMTFIGAWIESNPSIIRQLPSHSPAPFDWAHARLLAMFGPEDDALKYFKTQVTQTPDKALAHYGYGLILTRTGNRGAAMDQFRTALTKRAFDPTILTELGRTYFLDGRYAEALGTLQGSLDISPDATEGLFYTGRCLIELGKFQEATRFLESLLRSTPDYPDALFYLGSAYGSLGKTSDACYYLGSYYYTRGDYKNAVVQLEKAMESTTDPEKKSEIEILLKDAKKRHTLKVRESETRKR